MNTQRITDNFTIEEFEYSQTAKGKGITNTIPECLKPSLVNLCTNLLQPLRDKYGKQISINSGYRCAKLNEAVGGVPTSQHRLCEAADCKCENPKQLLETLKSSGIAFDQAILYPPSKGNFLHLSLKKSGINRNQIIIK